MIKEFYIRFSLKGLANWLIQLQAQAGSFD